MYSEQSKPEWELVDLQYQPILASTKGTRNGVTSDNHQISPSEGQQVTVAVGGIDQLGLVSYYHNVNATLHLLFNFALIVL